MFECNITLYSSNRSKDQKLLIRRCEGATDDFVFTLGDEEISINAKDVNAAMTLLFNRPFA